MKKLCVLMLLIVIMTAGVAHAGVMSGVKSWLVSNIISIVSAAGLTAMGGVLVKIVKTLKEAGEFMVVLGKALEDKRLTSAEIGSIYKEGKDVLNVWRKTPEQYK